MKPHCNICGDESDDLEDFLCKDCRKRIRDENWNEYYMQAASKSGESSELCAKCGTEERYENSDLCEVCSWLYGNTADAGEPEIDGMSIADYIEAAAKRISLDYLFEISGDLSANNPAEKQGIQDALFRYMAMKAFEPLVGFWQETLKGQTEDKALQEVMDSIANYLKVSELVDKEAGIQVFICPKCDTENGLHVRFCTECGEDIAKIFKHLPPDEKPAASKAADYLDSIWSDKPDEE